MKFATQLTVLSVVSGMLALTVGLVGLFTFQANGGWNPVSPALLVAGILTAVFTITVSVTAAYLGVKLRRYLKIFSRETHKVMTEKDGRVPMLEEEFGECADLFNQMIDKVDDVLVNLELSVKGGAKDLTRANSSLQAVLNSVGEPIVVIGRDNRITRINRLAVEMLSYDDESEAIGKMWCEVAVPLKDGNPMTDADCPASQAMMEGEPRFSGIRDGVTYRGRRQEDLPVQVTASPLLDGGEVTGAVIVFKDITVESAIDMAKTDFVSLASHQLRTPLSSINWYTEVLSMEMKPGCEVSEEWIQYLKIIEANSLRMANLINSLLNVSRIETDRIQVVAREVDLAVLVSDVITELKSNFADRKFRITRHFEEKSMVIHGDARVIESVVAHLISNAIKYSKGEAGKIHVYLKWADDGGAMMTVRDNGIGVSKRDQRQIFDKLFRAENAKQIDANGNGLGLYITKNLVELAGGKISFESELKKGSSFTVFWPAEPVTRSFGERPILSQ